MPEDRLAERLAQARRLATEARLDRLDAALAGLRADAVTDGGVPADLEVELAVIRASALLNLERPTEAWDGLQVVRGRLEDASLAVQGRFHSMSGTAAHFFDDADAAHRGGRAGARRAGRRAGVGGARDGHRVLRAHAGVLPAVPAGRRGARAGARRRRRGGHAARPVAHAGPVRAAHLGDESRAPRPGRAARPVLGRGRRHHEAVLAAPDALPDVMRALSCAERSLLAGRLGDAATAREKLQEAIAVPVGAESPSLRRLLAHAEGAALFAEGRFDEARQVLLGLWESISGRCRPARRRAAAAGPGRRGRRPGRRTRCAGIAWSTPGTGRPSRRAGRPGRPRPGCGSSRRRCCGAAGSWRRTR